MSRAARFLIGLALLAGLLALSAWTNVNEVHPRQYCVDDHANPVCDRLELDR